MDSSALETVKRLWRILVRPHRRTLGLFNSCQCKTIRRSARNTCISNVIWSVACLGTMRARTVSLWPTYNASSKRTLQMWKHITISVNCWLRVLKINTPSKLTQSSTLSKLLSFKTKSFTMETQCSKLLSSDLGKKITMRPFTVSSELQITILHQKDSHCIKTLQKESYTWLREKSKKECKFCRIYLKFSSIKIRMNQTKKRLRTIRLIWRKDRPTKPM